MLFALKNWPFRLAAIGAAMIAVGVDLSDDVFFRFSGGRNFSDALCRKQNSAFANWQAAGMVLAGGYLFCFSAGENHLIHAPIKAMLPAGDTAHFVWDLSAALIIMVLLGNSALCSVFLKNWAVWLGQLSFPIYLLHVPIMLSAGAVSILAAIGRFGMMGAVLLAAGVTVALTLACALPLAWIDNVWTNTLTRVTVVLMKRRVARFRTD